MPKPTPGQTNWGTQLNTYLDGLEAGIPTPGNAGELVATVGGAITNVKPGRIDARVRGVSTASSDNTTLLATLAAESGTEGSELWIPEGTYRHGEVSIPSNARINGRGTLKQRATSPSQTLLQFATGADV